MKLIETGGLTSGEAKKQAPVARIAESAVEFANKYFQAELLKLFCESFGVDPEHRFLEANLKTSIHSKSISYTPTSFILSFNPSYYFSFFGENQSEADKELIIANLIFHEYGHHIQNLMKKFLKEQNKAWIEDVADYMSGFLLAKYIEAKSTVNSNVTGMNAGTGQ